ncbi:hypothetical protein H8D36_06800 [archaeon]|nr:hypothetical protein [archaeon]
MSFPKLNKKADFDFVWLFAILAGAAILMLAIYGATKGADTLRYQQETQQARSLSVVLGPLQAGFSDSKTNAISFKQDTRITNFCSEEGFGTNKLSTATKSNIGDKWSSQGGETTVKNQYIFSSFQEGKKFEILSRPFNYPFKVGDLLFISAEKYCLPQIPNDLKNEIKGLGLSNWQTENCTQDIPTICFGSTNCDINVIGTCTSDCKTKYDEGYVQKDGDRFYYVGSLMYGAIFAEKELYDCNVNRLIYKTKQISEILADEAKLMDSRGCPTSMQPELTFWAKTLNTTVPDSIVENNGIAKSIEKKQSLQGCQLW